VALKNVQGPAVLPQLEAGDQQGFWSIVLAKQLELRLLGA